MMALLLAHVTRSSGLRHTSTAQTSSPVVFNSGASPQQMLCFDSSLHTSQKPGRVARGLRSLTPNNRDGQTIRPWCRVASRRRASSGVCFNPCSRTQPPPRPAAAQINAASLGTPPNAPPAGRATVTLSRARVRRHVTAGGVRAPAVRAQLPAPPPPTAGQPGGGRLVRLPPSPPPTPPPSGSADRPSRPAAPAACNALAVSHSPASKVSLVTLAGGVPSRANDASTSPRRRTNDHTDDDDDDNDGINHTRSRIHTHEHALDLAAGFQCRSARSTTRVGPPFPDGNGEEQGGSGRRRGDPAATAGAVSASATGENDETLSTAAAAALQIPL